MEAPRAGAGAGTVRRWLNLLETRVPHDLAYRTALFNDIQHYLHLTRIISDVSPAAVAVQAPRQRVKRGSTAPQALKPKKTKGDGSKKKTGMKKRRKSDESQEELEDDDDDDDGVWTSTDVVAVRAHAAELIVAWHERYRMEAPSLVVAAVRAAPLAVRPRSEVLEAHWCRVDTEARERMPDVEECLAAVSRCFDLMGLNDFAPAAKKPPEPPVVPKVAKTVPKASSVSNSEYEMGRMEQRPSEEANVEEDAEGYEGIPHVDTTRDDVVVSAGLGSGAWQLEVSVSLASLRSADTAPLYEELTARTAQLTSFALLLSQWLDVARTAATMISSPIIHARVPEWERVLERVQAAQRRCAEVGALKSKSASEKDVQWM